MSTTGQGRRLWEEWEDQKLRQGVRQQAAAHGAVRDWNQIARALPRRSNKDCRKRWSKISKDVKKGSWDAEEDRRLKEAIRSYGLRWTQVAEHVGTRHADQCAKRWTHNLDPSLNQNNWTEEEDMALLAAVGERGRNWRNIAETSLVSRHSVAIKHRYTVLQQRETRDREHRRRRPAAASSSGQKTARFVPHQRRAESKYDASDGTDSDYENYYEPVKADMAEHVEGFGGQQQCEQDSLCWGAVGNFWTSFEPAPELWSLESPDSFSYGGGGGGGGGGVDMMSAYEPTASLPYVPDDGFGADMLGSFALLPAVDGPAAAATTPWGMVNADPGEMQPY